MPCNVWTSIMLTTYPCLSILSSLDCKIVGEGGLTIANGWRYFKNCYIVNIECDLNLAMSNFWYKVSRGLKVWQSAQRLSSSAWSGHNVMVARTLEKQETLSKTHLISPSQHSSTGQIIKKSSVLFVCNKCWMYFMFLFSTLLLSSWTHRNHRIWSRLISWQTTGGLSNCFLQSIDHFLVNKFSGPALIGIGW